MEDSMVAPQDQIRIVVLGDSIAYESLGFVSIIRDRLQAIQGHRFEIINASIPGYTTYQELEFLKLYGLLMDPDMVVLGFVFNDVYYNYLHKPVDQTID